LASSGVTPSASSAASESACGEDLADVDGLGLLVRGLLGHLRPRGGHAQVALHDSGELLGALTAFVSETEVAVAGSLAIGVSVHSKRPLGGVGAQGLQELFVGDAAVRMNAGSSLTTTRVIAVTSSCTSVH
jgi:hypothetical protein